jgi:hypothetical protein
MEQIQDVEKQEEGKTWRKDSRDGCLCQTLKQFQGCRYFPPDKDECPFLDPLGYFKCVLKVSA